MQVEPLLTKGDVTRIVGISPRTLENWVAAGKFPRPLRLNGQRLARFRPEDVQAWIDVQPRA